MRGRVIVAAELKAQQTWVLDEDRAKVIRTSARMRRPMGRKLLPLTEPMPTLAVVLEGTGLRPTSMPPATLSVEGMRFNPSQALLARPGALVVENKQRSPFTLVDDKGRALATVAPNATAQVSLPEGVHTLSVREMPYCQALVRVLGHGVVLPLQDSGDIPLVAVPGGDYTLSFFLGASPLRVQPLSVPERGLIFIDAAVSARGVVDVSLKDGSMRQAVVPTLNQPDLP